MSSPAPRKFKRKCKPGKSCDNCGTDNTPNWRRGWPLADGNHANLCNACGIRYKPGKGRKGGDLVVRPPFVPPPKQGPTKGMWTTPVKALEPAPGLPTELPEEVSGAPKPRGGARASSAPRRRPSSASRPRPRRRRARSFSSDDSGDDDAASEEEEEEDGAGADEPEADPSEVPLLARQRFALAPPDVPPQPAARKRTGGARKAVRHVTHAEDRPLVAPKAALPPSRFRGFFRSSCAALDKDKHEMYFLRHANGAASLAAVGVDIYGTGHFRYTAVTGLAAPPLHDCTRREDLVAWLASLGAETDLGSDDGTAGAAASTVPAPGMAIPPMATPAEAAAAALAAAVAAPPGGWVSWREENTLQAGRRVRSFYLIGKSGHKTLAVLGAESGGRAGAFDYTSALPLALPAGGPPLLLPLPGRAEVLSFLRAAVRASGGSSDEAPAAAGPPAEDAGANADFAAALQGVANLTDSGVRRRQAPERFDPRPPASAPPAAPKLRTPPARAAGGGGGAGFGIGVSYDPAFTRFAFGPGGFPMPMPMPMMPMPMPVPMMYGGGGERHHPPPFPQRGLETPLAARGAVPPLALQPPRGGFAFGASASERVDAAELAAKVGCTATRWALASPTPAQVAQFKAWAAELQRGVLPVGAQPAPEPAAASLIVDPDAPATPVSEARALELLSALERSEISLELLEASQIGRSVALLRTQQASPVVSAAADRIARSWRATADAIIAAVGSPMAQSGATPGATLGA